MKKLSEYKNEDALDLLADIIDPVAKIFADKKLTAMISGKKPAIDSVKYAIKQHKKEVIEVLATLNGQSVAEYEANPVTILMQLMEVINDQELVDFFESQRRMME